MLVRCKSIRNLARSSSSSSSAVGSLSSSARSLAASQSYRRGIVAAAVAGGGSAAMSRGKARLARNGFNHVRRLHRQQQQPLRQKQKHRGPQQQRRQYRLPKRARREDDSGAKIWGMVGMQFRSKIMQPVRSKGTQTIQDTAANTAAGAAASNAAGEVVGRLPFYKRFGIAYEASLAKRPILTKSITGGILYGLGDFLGQSLSGEIKLNGFDFPRLSRAMLFGGVFYPLPAHLHYNFLESLTVRMGITASRAPFFKAFVEQFVYWSYLSNGYYHAVLGALQGMGPSAIYQRVSDTLWDTLKAQWVFWIPVQLLNFKYVPVRHQLNFVLVVSLAWTSFLSIAFPPDLKAKAQNTADSQDQLSIVAATTATEPTTQNLTPRK